MTGSCRQWMQQENNVSFQMEKEKEAGRNHPVFPEFRRGFNASACF
ncbi:hypothetical protein HMPREF3039_03257 [Akkermansia sp. KLE1798]|nr:hypothetical protein HMPREF3039_03257 [Akkermansia sp. KLE1798]KZA03261.1 hypothetical protein HMPREF1326_03088 [Akkermansia sp. KLE1605]